MLTMSALVNSELILMPDQRLAFSEIYSHKPMALLKLSFNKTNLMS